MRKFSVVLIIVIVLLTAGCINSIAHHYIFTGESKTWTGELRVNSTEEYYEQDGADSYYNENTRLAVTCKGELSDLSSIKSLVITYEYELPDCASSESKAFDTSHISKKTFTLSGSESGNGMVIQEDTIVKVSINIDGKIETMELKEN